MTSKVKEVIMDTIKNIPDEIDEEKFRVLYKKTGVDLYPERYCNGYLKRRIDKHEHGFILIEW